jgi:hypothetical protein
LPSFAPIRTTYSINQSINQHHTTPPNIRTSPATIDHISTATVDRPKASRLGLAKLVKTTSVTIGAVGFAPDPEFGLEALMDDSAESPPVGLRLVVDFVLLFDVLTLFAD